MKTHFLAVLLLVPIIQITGCAVSSTTVNTVYTPAVAPSPVYTPAVYTPAIYPGSPYWGSTTVYWGNYGYWGQRSYWRGYRAYYGW